MGASQGALNRAADRATAVGMGRRELHGVRWGRWVVMLAAALVGCEEEASPSADAGASDVVVTAIDASDDIASADDLRSDPRNCGARGHVCVRAAVRCRR